VLRTSTAGGVADLAVYAHRTPGDGKCGITYAIVNSSETKSRTVTTPTGEAEAYQLTGDPSDPHELLLNGDRLDVSDDGALPELQPKASSGALAVPPGGVTFVVDRSATIACN
jgi:hypothetical protein